MPHTSAQANRIASNTSDDISDHHLDAIVGGGLTTFYSVRNESAQDSGDPFNGHYFVQDVNHAYTHIDS